MRISNFLFIICIHMTVAVSGQIPSGKFTPEESHNLQTITKAIHYLKAQKTQSLDSFDSTSIKVIANQYKDFLETFFDLNFIIDTGSKRSPFLSKDFQSALIYNIDHYLDVLPLDSVYIAPISYFDKENSSVPDSGSFLNVFYRMKGKEVIIYTIQFNEKGKINSIGPYIDFEKEYKDIDIQGFYQRQKGFEQIKGKLYDLSRG